MTSAPFLETVDPQIWVAAVLFFLVAFAYSSVGLGGGSSYTSLMAILGFNYLAIPLISLSLNILVTTLGSFNYLKNRHGRLSLILPFLVTSIPFSYLGGTLEVEKSLFYPILFITLFFVFIRLVLFKKAVILFGMSRLGKIFLSLGIGAILGLVSGIVGIGGGIYLVPLVVVFGLGDEKEAAASGAIFIWLNSVAGLTARLQYNSVALYDYFPMVLAVALGGFLGSYLGAVKFSRAAMQNLLAFVVFVALYFLAQKIFV
ncbi:MAG: sulfite exporter TauE/SafE family protein [SAR324 cluster bacterium]|nr:sulfite exporter TauE/SafE family protein [SAR324 cluster bacterium]